MVADAVVIAGGENLALDSLICVVDNWATDNCYGDRRDMFDDKVRSTTYSNTLIETCK